MRPDTIPQSPSRGRPSTQLPLPQADLILLLPLPPLILRLRLVLLLLLHALTLLLPLLLPALTLLLLLRPLASTLPQESRGPCIALPCHCPMPYFPFNTLTAPPPDTQLTLTHAHSFMPGTLYSAPRQSILSLFFIS